MIPLHRSHLSILPFFLFALLLLHVDCAQAQGGRQSAAQLSLADISQRTAKEKGKLSILIPKSESVSDLVRIMSENPYGSLHPEVQGVAEAKSEQLTKEGKVLRDGESMSDFEAAKSRLDLKLAALSRQLSDAAPADKRKLRATDRARMVREVAWAGLVESTLHARKLTDSQLQELHREALPILELQRTKLAAEQARDAAQGVQRALQTW